MRYCYARNATQLTSVALLTMLRSQKFFNAYKLDKWEEIATYAVVWANVLRSYVIATRSTWQNLILNNTPAVTNVNEFEAPRIARARNPEHTESFGTKNVEMDSS